MRKAESKTTVVMEVKIATVLASALSTVAILSCLIAVPTIYSEVQSIWVEIDAEMDQFRVRCIGKRFISSVKCNDRRMRTRSGRR